MVLMLENRSFDHMLGWLYTDEGNVSPSKQPYEGLTGTESDPDENGRSVTVFRVDGTAAGAEHEISHLEQVQADLVARELVPRG